MGTSTLQQQVRALRRGLDASRWQEGENSRAVCIKLLNTEVNTDSPDYQLPPFEAARAYELYRTLFGVIDDLIKDKQLLVVPRL